MEEKLYERGKKSEKGKLNNNLFYIFKSSYILPKSIEYKPIYKEGDRDDLRGEKGEKGKEGPQGKRGNDGKRGERGHKGDQGSAAGAVPGPQGEKGARGAQGAQGNNFFF